jgi:hypothetical protein
LEVPIETFYTAIDCTSHRSLISIQYLKKKLKLKFYGLPTPFHMFSYIKKRDERDREKEERNKTEERQKKLKMKSDHLNFNRP